MTVTGFAISIPGGNTIMWDDTGQIWRRMTLETNGAIKLGSDASIPHTYWLSGETLFFRMFRN